jgi:homoprotocatechuate degradation regulator HpaR
VNDFDRSLPMLLYRALDLIMPRFRAIFGGFGLTEQQWRVLRVLWQRDGRALLELADATLISAPSMVGVVDRLARSGLVERRRSQSDRRVVRVFLTGRGRDLEEQVTPLVDAAYADLRGSVGEGDWEVLLGALARLNAGLADLDRIDEVANR